ncbi:hypothetical protein L1049_015160 [Liquidambar formosana]|uniref:DUF8040 domain-containing protein n=1 Tax=Liquidambar formosana TaxID=63359 RepID=A0AAP0S381_LIQFO
MTSATAWSLYQEFRSDGVARKEGWVYGFMQSLIDEQRKRMGKDSCSDGGIKKKTMIEVLLKLQETEPETKRLRNTSNVDVEEQVAMFLYILGHNLRLHVIANNFSRSLDTVHRHFLNVLKAVVKLYKDLVKPLGINSSLEIGSNFRTWHSYFKHWAILRTDPFFDIKVQVKIVIACCTLHNFILNVDLDDLLEHELNDASEDLGSDQVILEEDVANLATSLEWSGRRDALATLMWNEYNR